MARNSISYEGRIVDNNGQREFGKYTESGMSVLKLVIAEQHQAKNKNAGSFQDKSKGEEEWVDTTVSWHRVTLFGEQAEELAQDPEIARGAIVVVTGASYSEEEPWKTKENVLRAGRPETIGKDGKIEVLERGGYRFGPKAENEIPAWDGVSDIPIIKGKGGGNRAEPNYDEQGI